MLTDLETLTGIKINEWIVEVDGEEYDADEDVLKQVMKLSPHEYRLESEEGLNEMRQLSGMETTKQFNEQDEAIKHFKSLAGL